MNTISNYELLVLTNKALGKFRWYCNNINQLDIYTNYNSDNNYNIKVLFGFYKHKTLIERSYSDKLDLVLKGSELYYCPIYNNIKYYNELCKLININTKSVHHTLNNDTLYNILSICECHENN